MEKTILCELAFLEKFSARYSESMPLLDEESRHRLTTWIELFDFIVRSDIVFDCTASLFEKLTQNDSRLEYLWKKYAGGDISMEFNDSFINLHTLLKDHPFSVLMTCKGEESIAKKYGLININESNCLNKRGLFIDNGQHLHKDDIWYWDSFGNSLPEKASNSMIIIDNYILKNGERDLYEILYQLLPNRCDIGYHLSIFYYADGQKTIEIIRNNILAKLKDTKPKLIKNLQLELIRLAGMQDFHDRTIITNNYWISIGGGFDITRLNKKTRTLRVKRTTNMEIVYPYFASLNIRRIDKAYENLIADVREELPLARANSNNRLLHLQD